MTSLTLAKLESGARDLQTVEDFANSTARTTTTRNGETVPTRAGLTAEFPQAVAAAAMTRMKATPADGVADVGLVDGSYFTTPSTATGEAAIVYQKIGGAALDTGIRLPSTALVPQTLPPESGYVWALMDSALAAAMMIAADGAVSIPKLLQLDGSIVQAKLAAAVQDRLGRDLSAESGYVWALVDSQDRLALGITPDGKVVGNIAGVAGSNYLQPTSELIYIGDSLTAGAGGQTTWRERLQALRVTRTHTSYAIGGQTSSQIAARLGAYPSLLTVSGNQIPASGAVSVTARTISLLTDQGAQSIVGTLWGVPGTLTRAVDDSYSFARTTAGTAVNVGAKIPLMPSIGDDDFGTLLIFVGRNNATDPTTVERDIAALVALQKTAEKRFLILTPPNGGSVSAGVPTNEGTGSAFLTAVKQIEDWATQTYGDRVLKTREFSFQFNNGSADDLDDVAKETVPRSLRIDAIHWTTALHQKVGDWVDSELTRRGW